MGRYEKYLLYLVMHFNENIKKEWKIARFFAA